MATRKTTKKPTKKTSVATWRTGKDWTGASVDDYLGAVPKDARTALGKLRKTIKAAAPHATEGISYQVPMFKLNGRPLVSFAAATGHCAFYVQSPSVMRAHATELKDYEVGKGSIRFAAHKPLPASLVTRLVKARIAENETLYGSRGA